MHRRSSCEVSRLKIVCNTTLHSIAKIPETQSLLLVSSFSLKTLKSKSLSDICNWPGESHITLKMNTSFSGCSTPYELPHMIREMYTTTDSCNAEITKSSSAPCITSILNPTRAINAELLTLLANYTQAEKVAGEINWLDTRVILFFVPSVSRLEQRSVG